LRTFDQTAQTNDFKIEKEIRPIVTKSDVTDKCACKGIENLPTDFFIEKGYSESYGSSCSSWDFKADYC
jgi:hypothetical protein